MADESNDEVDRIEHLQCDPTATVSTNNTISHAMQAIDGNRNTHQNEIPVINTFTSTNWSNTSEINILTVFSQDGKEFDKTDCNSRDKVNELKCPKLVEFREVKEEFVPVSIGYPQPESVSLETLTVREGTAKKVFTESSHVATKMSCETLTVTNNSYMPDAKEYSKPMTFESSSEVFNATVKVPDIATSKVKQNYDGTFIKDDKNNRRFDISENNIISCSCVDDIESHQKNYSKKYTCGGCSYGFITVCLLHEHLKLHGSGGSYHFDHVSNTAFPKYDTFCSFTQTDFGMFDERIDVPEKPLQVEEKFSPSHTVTQEETRKSRKRKQAHPRPSKSPIKKTKSKEFKKEIGFIDDLGEVTDDYDVGYVDVSSEKGMHEETSVKKHQTGSVPNDDGFSEKARTKEPKKADGCCNFIDPGKVTEILKEELQADDVQSSETKSRMRTLRSGKARLKRGRRGSSYFRMNMKDNWVEKPPDNVTKEKTRNKQHTISENSLMPSMKKNEKMLKNESALESRETEESNDEIGILEVPKKTLKENKCHKTKAVKQQRDKPVKVDDDKISAQERKERKKAKKAEENLLQMCEFCKQPVRKKNFSKHMMSHTGEKTWMCEVCGKAFGSRQQLWKHQISHREVKPWPCTLCPAQFCAKKEYKVHMASHQGHRPHVCNVCDKRFITKKSLLQHQENIHMGITKFQCDHCDRRFFKKSGLMAHQATHFEASLECKYCERKFRDKTSLKRHERIHTGIKMYQCHICDHAFNQCTPYFVHMEKRHDLSRPVVKEMLQHVHEANKRSGKKAATIMLPRDIDNLVTHLVAGTDMNTIDATTSGASTSYTEMEPVKTEKVFDLTKNKHTYDNEMPQHTNSDILVSLTGSTYLVPQHYIESSMTAGNHDVHQQHIQDVRKVEMDYEHHTIVAGMQDVRDLHRDQKDKTEESIRESSACRTELLANAYSSIYSQAAFLGSLPQQPDDTLAAVQSLQAAENQVVTPYTYLRPLDYTNLQPGIIYEHNPRQNDY